jgi:acetyltransferase-like isoleucine patch superfamily enzyme
MRKITWAQTAVFAAMFFVAAILSLATTKLLLGEIPFGDFRGVALVVAAIFFFYLYAVAAYRAFLFVAPLSEGSIPEGSREEFIYHVYELFYLVLFYSITRSLFLPVPLTRLLYRILGARLGFNSYSGGTLLDPPLTVMGDNCIIGHDAVLFCHEMEGDNLSLAKIRMGDNVTIGAKAVVMPGVTIGDGAVVAVNAVVTKGTQIGAGELWAGIPARRIK